jgi:uncharacterized protein VirK/YbjX
MILAWAWSASKQADPSLKMRAKFVAAALRARALSSRLASTNLDSPMAELLAECPETIGALLWPYQCAAWDAETRFSRISEHLNAVHQIPGLTLALEDKLVFADLSWVSSGVSLIIDRAPWLAREGHLTLSLFKDDFRAFSVSFSLLTDPEPSLSSAGCRDVGPTRYSPCIATLQRTLKACAPATFCLKA